MKKRFVLLFIVLSTLFCNKDNGTEPPFAIATRDQLIGNWIEQTSDIFHRKQYVFTDDSCLIFIPENDTVVCPNTKRFSYSWKISNDSIIVWDTIKTYYFKSLNYNLINNQTLLLKLLGETEFATYNLVSPLAARDDFVGGWVLDTAFIEQTPKELYRTQYSFTDEKITYIESKGPGQMPESKSAAWAIVDDTIMICDSIERYGYGTALFTLENDSVLMIKQLDDSIYRRYDLRYEGMEL